MAAVRQIGAYASRALSAPSSSRSVMGVGGAAGQGLWQPSRGRGLNEQVASSSFSTSASQHARPKNFQKKGPAKVKTAKTPKSANAGVKKNRKLGRDDDTQLSRSNPFLQPKQDMSFLKELLPEHATEANVNNVYAWSERTLEAMQYPSGFGMNSALVRSFRNMPRPRTILRPQSLQLFGALDEAAAGGADSSPVNAILHAPEGYGMSTLLMQCFSYALESGWIVVAIPRALTLVDSSSTYAYSEAQQTYLQPDAVREILQQITNVNGSLLAQVKVQGESIELPRNAGTIAAGSKLSEVIKLGTNTSTQPEAAQIVFETVVRTLAQQKNVPVLLAIDGFEALFSTSDYRDPDYRRLESYELAVPRTLQACLRTQGTGAYGGIQRGAMLATMNPQQTEWPVPRELAMAHPVLAPNRVEPYAKLNQTRVEIIQACDLRIFDLSKGSQLTQSEAGALFDMSRREGMLWTNPNDEIFLSKLIESGGNFGKFERSLRKAMV